MDQGSMDPLFGLGPWTTFMDRVHGLPVMDQAHGQFLNFYKKVLHQVRAWTLRNRNSAKKRFDETLLINAYLVPRLDQCSRLITNIQLCLHDVHSACTCAVTRLLN